jgi:hypothetical protein
MTHIGKDTRSRIISKGISAGKSKNSYRGAVNVTSKALGARNYSQCDLFTNWYYQTFRLFRFKIPLRRLSMKLRPLEQIFLLFTTRYLSRKAVELMWILS